MADLSKYGTVTTAGPGRGGYAPVDISKYGTVSKATENPNQAFSEKYPQLGSVVGAAGDLAQGVGSSAFSSLVGAYNLIRMVPGVGDKLPPPNEFATALTHEPDTIAGHAGKMAESMGEFMIPAGKVEKMQKGASLIARMAGQGGAAGVVRMVQSGGDVGSSLDTAAMGAAGPVIGAAIGAMTPKAVQLAKAAGMKIGLSVAGRLTGLPIKGIHDLIVRGAGIAPEVAAAIGKDAELLDGIAQGYGYKSFAGVPASGQQIIRNQATAIANSIAGEAAPVAAAPAAVPLAGVTPSGPVRPPVATAAQMMREAGTFRPTETFVPGGPLRPPVRTPAAAPAAAAEPVAPAEMPALPQIAEWLANRDGGTASRFTDPVVSEAPITKQTLGDIMDRLMRNRKVPAEVPAATVPAEVPPAAVPEIVPPAAVETPQPATLAPSAAGKPVTAATLMEEATKPAGKKVPPFDWTDEAQYKEYQKALVEDSNIYGNNRTTMADRVTRFMKKNGIEPTDSGIVKALEQSAEDIAVSPTTGLKRPSFNAADHEVLFDMIKDRMETPTAGVKPVAAAPAIAKPGAVPEVPKAATKPPVKPRSKQTTVGELMGKAQPEQSKFTIDRLKQFHPNATAAQIETAMEGVDTSRPLTQQGLKDAIKRLGDTIAEQSPKASELVAPKLLDAPRPLKKVYGSNWMERADAAQIKSQFNKATRERTKSLQAYKKYVEESNRRFYASKEYNSPEAVARRNEIAQDTNERLARIAEAEPSWRKK